MKRKLYPYNTIEHFLGQLTTSNDRSLFELRIPFIVGQVTDSSLNRKADLKQGDIISAINGKQVKYFDQFAYELGIDSFGAGLFKIYWSNCLLRNAIF